MNKKQKRTQEKLENELRARDVEQAQETLNEEVAADIAEAAEVALSEADAGVEAGVGETADLEFEADGVTEFEDEAEDQPKSDVNAASKAQAESRRKERAARNEKELLTKYPHVVGITQRGLNGPTRVKIRCTDPQSKQVDGKAVSVCEKEREIAVQDLFQVTRCAACQDRVLRKARRDRQAKKNKELRKFAREMKGTL